MSTKFAVYSEEERLSLLHSYYESGMSKNAFCKLHGLSTIKLLNNWIAKYTPSGEDELPLPATSLIEDMSNRSKEDYQEENAQLKKRIKELEKALTFSKLETEARDMMISCAEEYFKIPIRKKSGVK
jgi:transposase-like protein